MKVEISVTRETQYTSIVEMSEEDFERLDEALYSSDRQERRDAREEVNNLIDTHDWQDDSLRDVDEFKPFVEA